MTKSWDDPLAPDPSRLLTVLELEDIHRAFATLVPAVALTFAASPKLALVGSAVVLDAATTRVLVYCAGDPVYSIAAVTTSSADNDVIAAMKIALEVAAHHAFSRQVSTQTHEAAMDVNFDEVTHANEQLARSAVRLGEVDRLKNHLMANMSHELRTPLTAIMGYSEMMLDGFAGAVSSEQREYLTTILAKAEQLLGLITSVLEVSSLDTMKREPPKMISFIELIKSELATLRPALERYRLEVEVRAHSDDQVLGNARQLRQVVNCLLSNAAKFSAVGGRIEVSVKTDPSLLSGGAVVFEVVDHGVGIAADKLIHIFEPFYQVDPTSTRAYGGTGIGLTLVKAYVESHRGTVTVTSKPLQGSKFRVVLPLPMPV
jgi:two-component system, NarL family, sensor histidine kinase BarA